MKLRIALNTGFAREPVRVVEVEADKFMVVEGRLEVYNDARNPIVVYAPGVWRTIADAGAVEKAMSHTSENTGRNQPTRQATAP
jgi:hypothetical protein